MRGGFKAAALNRLSLVLAGIVSTLVSTNIGAQMVERKEVPLGSRAPSAAPARIPDQVGLSDADRSRVAMIEYAQCVVDRHRGWVLAALAERISPPGSLGKVGKLNVQECMGSNIERLRMRTELLRGAFYVAFYRSDFGRSDASTPKVIDFASDVPGKTPDEVQYVAMRQFGGCVVIRKAMTVRTAVLSPPGSPQERAAYGELSPSFGDCAEVGASVKFSKTFLSGLLAEVLYRETASPDPTMAGAH